MLFFRYSVTDGDRDDDWSAAIFMYQGDQEPFPGTMVQDGQACFLDEDPRDAALDNCIIQAGYYNQDTFMLLDEDQGTWQEYRRQGDTWVEAMSHPVGELMQGIPAWDCFQQDVRRALIFCAEGGMEVNLRHVGHHGQATILTNITEDEDDGRTYHTIRVASDCQVQVYINLDSTTGQLVSIYSREGKELYRTG